MAKLTPDEVIDMLGHKLQLLGIRASDPAHPMHTVIEWQDGVPVLPQDEEGLCALVLAAMSEPEPH